MTRTNVRARCDGGFVAAEWVLGLGLIVLPLILIVASVAPWLARQTTALLVSQEAARTMVLADDWASGLASATQTTETIAANHGIPTGDLHLVSVTTNPPGASLARGVDVMVEARVRLPILVVPGIGTVAEVWWSTRHVEHVDDFRSFP